MQIIEGDFLGAESYLDLRADMEDFGQCSGGVRRKQRVKAVKKELPPPLPWLARTENFPTAQMPWVMKRSYTEDGRLIITEEMAERYQYFRVDRSDQGLRMDLVKIKFHPFWREEQELASDETPEEFVPAESLVGEQADHGGGSGATAAEMVVGGDNDGGGGGGNKCSSGLVFGVAGVPPALHRVPT